MLKFVALKTEYCEHSTSKRNETKLGAKIISMTAAQNHIHVSRLVIGVWLTYRIRRKRFVRVLRFTRWLHSTTTTQQNTPTLTRTSCADGGAHLVAECVGVSVIVCGSIGICRVIGIEPHTLLLFSVGHTCRGSWLLPEWYWATKLHRNQCICRSLLLAANQNVVFATNTCRRILMQRGTESTRVTYTIVRRRRRRRQQSLNRICILLETLYFVGRAAARQPVFRWLFTDKNFMFSIKKMHHRWCWTELVERISMLGSSSARTRNYTRDEPQQNESNFIWCISFFLEIRIFYLSPFYAQLFQDTSILSVRPCRSG